jgi:hypothetical protein
VDLDETPATAHDALNSSQTKAATRKFGGEKGIEDPRLDAFIHAAPVVCDFQADKVAGLDIERRGVRAGCFRRHLANASGDLNAAIGVGRYGFAGIDYQIHKNLLDLARSGFDEQFLGRQIKPKLHSLGNGSRQKLPGAQHEVREIEGCGDDLTLAGIRQQLTREVRGALRRRNDVLIVSARRALNARGAGATKDNREQVIEIVSDPARKQADALQFLRLPQALLVLFALRDIKVCANGPAGAADGVKDRYGVGEKVSGASVLEQHF